jgi:hypothetical protein
VSHVPDHQSFTTVNLLYMISSLAGNLLQGRPCTDDCHAQVHGQEDAQALMQAEQLLSHVLAVAPMQIRPTAKPRRGRESSMPFLAGVRPLVPRLPSVLAWNQCLCALKHCSTQ